MPILAAGQRRFLFEKSPLYLFSYDAPLSERARYPVPGGMGLDWMGPHTNRKGRTVGPSDTQAYHVLDQDSVEENDAIRGEVLAVRDTLFIPADGPTGVITGTAIIQTYDNARLDATYRGSLDLGSLSFRQFDLALTHAKDGAIAQKQRTVLKVSLAVRFETVFPKYNWLTEFQCAGFGRIELEDRKVDKATFDVYAMK
jgi:hypothetical protein